MIRAAGGSGNCPGRWVCRRQLGRRVDGGVWQLPDGAGRWYSGRVHWNWKVLRNILSKKYILSEK